MATKKITELPLIQTISGSFSVVPIVIGNTAGNGTTDQITIENFSKFVTAYSAHTGSAGNTFVGPQIINNNVTINGRLTVTEVVAQYETASILFSTGSTKLGDQLTDKHEFTGSTNITGSVIYNGVILTNIDANTIQKLQQATASIELASASFNYFYQSTASLQQFTSSQDARNFIISQFTSSTDAHIVGISNFTSSNFDTMARVYQTSASINIFTGSQDSRNFVISQYTSSTDAHIVGISTFTSSQYDTIARVYQTSASINIFTGSQDARNFIISQFTSSTNAHIVGISTFTSSQYDTMARVYQTTSSLNQFTASQDSRNLTLSTVTGSLIGITNGLMAFTAALDNTYATDAQLYQLYQATRSLELHSGSMVGVTNGLMAYTASNTSLNTGLRGEVDGIEAYTASLKAQAIVSSSTQVQNYDVFALNSNLYTSTGSLIGITNGLMAFTAALDNTYATDAQLLPILQATQSLELLSGSLIGITNGLMAFTAALDSTYATDAQLYQLYAETASIKAEIGGIELYTASLKAAAIVSSSTQVQNYDVFALNSNLYNSTGSIKGEIAGIEAYTASLKAAAIVSSSQQITNYYKFAETASANTFYGGQSVSGSVFVTSNAGFGTSDATGSGILKVISAGTQTAFSIGQSNSKRFTGFGANDLKVYGDDYFITTVDAFPISIGTDNISRITIANDGGISATGAITASNFRISTAGGGIDFSVTSNSSGTMTSELLNDYEEGTWTPVIEGETTNPTLTGYSTQVGRYTKIGRLVTVHCALQPSGTSVAGTGNLRFGGLPFTSANISDVIGTGVSSANGDFAWGSGKTQLVFNVASNSTKIGVWGMQNGTTEAGIPVNNFNNSAQYLLLSITYMAT